MSTKLFSWASSIARKRDELAKLRADRVKLYNVFPTARERNKFVRFGPTPWKLDELAIHLAEMERVNSAFSPARTRDELAAYLRADKERPRLHSYDLNAKVDYKTYLAAGVWTAVVSGAISVPVVYLLGCFGKFLHYKFPPVVYEYPEVEEDY